MTGGTLTKSYINTCQQFHLWYKPQYERAPTIMEGMQDCSIGCRTKINILIINLHNNGPFRFPITTISKPVP